MMQIQLFCKKLYEIHPLGLIIWLSEPSTDLVDRVRYLKWFGIENLLIKRILHLAIQCVIRDVTNMVKITSC